MSNARGDRYFVGLMSGTSLDAIDIALVKECDNNIELIHSYAIPIDTLLKERIAGLFEPGDNEIDKLGELDRDLAVLCARGVLNLLKQCGISASQVTAIGSHGQTVRHRPYGIKYKQPYTLQIGDPSTIAALTNIVTVADFRKKDIALGGQGAPLAPAFHAHMCRSVEHKCGVLNIGGIANLSIIDADVPDSVTGFDTGPGNGLMDAWIYEHKALPYDHKGQWALEGSVQKDLLNAMLSDPYFALPGPKSTGKEYFNLAWLRQVLASKKAFSSIIPVDIQATLLSLTSKSIVNALSEQKEIESLYLCGGGALNTALVESLKLGLDIKQNIYTTDVLGIPPMWVEAAAFAWMAKQTMDRLPSSNQSVTGASRNAILGGVFLP